MKSRGRPVCRPATCQDQVHAYVLFLTEQWQAYQDLDFDQSMLHAVYLTAGRNATAHHRQLQFRDGQPAPHYRRANFRGVPFMPVKKSRSDGDHAAIQEDWKTCGSWWTSCLPLERADRAAAHQKILGARSRGRAAFLQHSPHPREASDPSMKRRISASHRLYCERGQRERPHQ